MARWLGILVETPRAFLATRCIQLARSRPVSCGSVEEEYLVHVTVGANEGFDAALRRFNKKVQQEGIITESRRRTAFDKPSVLRKKKAAAKRRKARRAALKAMQTESQAL